MKALGKNKKKFAVLILWCNSLKMWKLIFIRCSMYGNMRCHAGGGCIWCIEQVGTQYNQGVPASVYSRTRNLAAVSVLVVLTWSQAAPSDPTILFGSHTSASSGPLCRKP